ncbi:MAG TPA: riboflavin synthase [bacterium]|nr:riboflavin synthase [bacterium]
MFTGLIEEIGRIGEINPIKAGRRLRIQAGKVLESLRTDDSVAVNGVCLTADRILTGAFEAVAVPETLKRSTLGNLGKDDPVNLERALRVGDRLGGHLVQGHVDGIGSILRIVPRGTGYEIEIAIPEDLIRYVAVKGSLAVNGISLTVAEIRSSRVRVAVIPHTWTSTTFNTCRTGDGVNIEVDILAKYVESLTNPRKGLSEEKLRAMGF